MTYLNHLTVTTGHSRRSYRHEVPDRALDMLAPVVRAAMDGARAPIPGPEPLTLRIPRHNANAMMAVFDLGGRSVAAMGVARTSKASATLWPLMGAPAGVACPAAPWIAVTLTPNLLDAPPRVARVLGDLERIVAWTWMERGDEASDPA